jgi:TonB-dependent SusC/RagA subfamily outer membrane receptor
VPDSVSDGYSERPKEEAGGVPSVAFKDGSKRKVARVEELLEGIAGVQVQRTGDGGYSVSIRGVGNMTSEQPLYVIDGVPYEPGPGGRGVGWLDPENVLRISVLKNPSETSIYGMRGANGVIVITTKRKR